MEKTVDEKLKELQTEQFSLAKDALFLMEEIMNSKGSLRHKLLAKLGGINKKMGDNNTEIKDLKTHKELKELLDQLPTFGVDFGIVGGDKTVEVPFCRDSLFFVSHGRASGKSLINEEMEKIKHFIKGKKVDSNTDYLNDIHPFGDGKIKKEDILGKEMDMLKDIRDHAGNALSNLYALGSAIEKLSKTESQPKELDSAEFQKELNELVSRFGGENLTMEPEFIYRVGGVTLETRYHIKFSTLTTKS